MALEQTLAKLGFSISILFIGFLLSQLISKILLRAYRSRRRIIRLEVDRKFRAVRYIIMTFTIMAAVAYLRADAIESIATATIEVLPDIVTAILLLLLGIITVNFIVAMLERVLLTIGIVDYASAYGKRQVLKLSMLAIKGFLYLVIAELLMSLMGIQSAALNAIIRIVVYGSFGLAAMLIFFGFRGIIEDLIAGMYVRSVGYFKPGKRIVLNGEAGEISNISNINVEISTDAGYTVVVPHRELLRRNMKFEKTPAELHALEDIKKHFVEQRPSYCGPACTQMSLSIFGYTDVGQDKIASLASTKLGSGTHPEKLREVIEDLTAGQVLGYWVRVDKIIDLKQELRAWLYDGALVIVDFKKKIVFPTIENDKAHFAVCVGMEGDDLIILDPSGTKGGVYLAPHQDVHRGMNTYSKLIKGKRGYLVIAPRGTTAYWRIKKGLVYADKDLYDHLSKSVERRFEKIIEKSAFIKNVFPEAINRYLRQWEERYRIARLWRPESDR